LNVFEIFYHHLVLLVYVPNFIEFGQHLVLGPNRNKFGTGMFLLNFIAQIF